MYSYGCKVCQQDPCQCAAALPPAPPMPPAPRRIHAYSNAEAFAEPIGTSAKLAAARALLKEVAYVWSGPCEKKCGRCLECRVAAAAEAT